MEENFFSDTSKVESPKPKAPRRPSRVPRRTSRTRSPRNTKFEIRNSNGDVPMTNEDQKRQLILAHAAVRTPVDRVQMFSLYAGVLVCALAIATGWLYSARQSIANTDTSAEMKTVQESYGDYRQGSTEATTMGQSLETQLKTVTEQLKTMSEDQTNAEQKTDEAMKDYVKNNFQIPEGVNIDQ